MPHPGVLNHPRVGARTGVIFESSLGDSHQNHTWNDSIVSFVIIILYYYNPPVILRQELSNKIDILNSMWVKALWNTFVVFW